MSGVDTSFKSSVDYVWMKKAMDAGTKYTPIYEILANMSLGGMSTSNVGYRETLKLQHDWG